MSYDDIKEVKKDAREMIDEALPSNCEPIYYVIGGSHLYGFPSPDSDYDIRGFHIAPDEEYLKLSSPDEQITVNQGTVTQGYEEYEDIELVSYELKKYGRLIKKMNFNVIEPLYTPERLIVMKKNEDLIENFKKDLSTIHLPGDMGKHYHGMAKSNYERYLNPEKESYKPNAKKFLYVIRGLLATFDTNFRHDVVYAPIPDIQRLFEINLMPNFNYESIQLLMDLLDVKEESSSNELDDDTIEKAHEFVDELFDKVEPRTYEVGDIDKTINEWMFDMRKEVKR